MSNLKARVAARSNALGARVQHLSTGLKYQAPGVEGRLSRMVGLTLEAVGCEAPLGSHCRIVSPSGLEVQAEVVGFTEGKLFLMPLEDSQGLTPDSRVIPLRQSHGVEVGGGLLGRVIDGAGRVLDARGPILLDQTVPLTGVQKNPLSRRLIREPFDVGIKAVNALLTLGRGTADGVVCRQWRREEHLAGFDDRAC